MVLHAVSKLPRHQHSPIITWGTNLFPCSAFCLDFFVQGCKSIASL
jgi:hypothetical protein